jgi:ABC-type phosphate transport system permease subunit
MAGVMLAKARVTGDTLFVQFLTKNVILVKNHEINLSHGQKTYDKCYNIGVGF